MCFGGPGGVEGAGVLATGEGDAVLMTQPVSSTSVRTKALSRSSRAVCLENGERVFSRLIPLVLGSRPETAPLAASLIRRMASPFNRLPAA